MTGGAYDVDVVLTAPDSEILYKQTKAQFDSHTFTTTKRGVYAVCFSNEFSTFTHKIVYMNLQIGEQMPLRDHVMTQMESSVHEIHKSINQVIDYQTHHRLREAQSRKRAEDLNERVFWWLLFETIAILTVTVGQVLVLKNFFSDKRPS